MPNMNIVANVIEVHADGTLSFSGKSYRCALGRGGVGDDKMEGDGKTPRGTFALRLVYFRPDRVDPPRTMVRRREITRDLGWCDEPTHPEYNREVALPHGGSHEVLWREDEVYDVVVSLGHNDDPPVAGKGSAIFLHVARPDYAPTAGCVALSLEDLLEVLAGCDPETIINIA